MAGANDRVHGYNPHYQDPGAVPRFAAFAMNGHPGPFVNQLVDVVGAPAVLDHQGHVVPQQMMDQVLDHLMVDMSNACNTPVAVAAYLENPDNNAQWMRPALQYGNTLNIPMFDFDIPHGPQTAEDRVGTLFSIVVWNPVNICRAPSDDQRAGVPGPHLDAAVLAWLHQHPNGVNQGWLAAATALGNAHADAPAVEQIRQYLEASTATLLGQLEHATGYYAFQWQLGPQLQGLVPA